VAFALRADGWWLRQDIIWAKPNPMPESVTDRCTKAHEYLFLLSKSERYYYDQDTIAEAAAVPKGSGNQQPYCIPGQRQGENSNLGGSLHKVGPRETRNKRSVWTVPTAPFSEAHFATFPPDLIKPCILAGAPTGGIVLDPFLGSGTTAMVAKSLGRRAWGIDANAEYLEMAKRRCAQMGMVLE
jgi:DNA modification methylase